MPVVGVLPHEDPGLPEEDSLALPDPGDAALWGDDDAPEARTVTVAVPRLPRASDVPTSSRWPACRASGSGSSRFRR